MPFDPGTLALLLLLGGWVALDGTSVGQFMVSRPLVAATLAGALAGDAAGGAMVGLLLEAFHLTVLPVGAARYPEGGPAAVVAGALAPAVTYAPGGLVTALLFFLLWGWLGGQSVHLLRKVNIRPPAPRAAPGIVALLQRRHIAAVALDFARGTALVALGLASLAALLELPRLAWGLDPRYSQMAITLLLAALLASSLRLFGDRRRLFALGAIGGLLTLLVRA